MNDTVEIQLKTISVRLFSYLDGGGRRTPTP
jgi:hypothetical protein